jgi:hypothetical protein
VPLVPPFADPRRLQMKMWSISVDPMPSRISMPKRPFQASKSGFGSASPADTQKRSDDSSYGNPSVGYARSAA